MTNKLIYPSFDPIVPAETEDTGNSGRRRNLERALQTTPAPAPFNPYTATDETSEFGTLGFDYPKYTPSDR